MQPRPFAAYAMLSASVVIWGISYPATRYALRFVPPFSLAFFRYGIAAILLSSCMGRRLRIPAREAGTVALLGLTGGLGFVTCMNLGMLFTSGVAGSLLSGAPPLLTALLARALLREPIGRWRAAGIAAGIAGVACVAGFPFSAGETARGAFAGALLVMGAQVCWALYTVLGRRAAPRLGGEAAGAWTTIAAAGLLLPLALAEAPGALFRPATPALVCALLYLSVVNTALAYLLWNRALRTVGASTAAGFQFLQPLSGAMFSLAVLGERMTAPLAAGAALIVAGVCLMAAGGGAPPSPSGRGQ